MIRVVLSGSLRHEAYVVALHKPILAERTFLRRAGVALQLIRRTAYVPGYTKVYFMAAWTLRATSKHITGLNTRASESICARGTY